MRIDLYTPTSATDSAPQISKVANQNTTASRQLKGHTTSTEDTTTLSSSSGTVKSLAQTALEPIPSRQAKVASLQFAVNNAQYQLDSAKTAEALSSADV